MDEQEPQREEIDAEGLLSTNAMIPPPTAGVLETANNVGAPTEVKPSNKLLTPVQDSLRRLRKDVRSMVCLSAIILFILIAVVGPIVYQHIGGPYQSVSSDKTVYASDYHGFAHQEPDRQHQGPSAMSWLGTDAIGRDMLARLMQGMLVSITVAVVVEIIDIVLGVTVGVLAGYYGGWIDQLLARFTDVMFAFPGLLFVILLTGIIGSQANGALGNIPIIGANGNARLLLVSIGLAITVWPLMARYVRGQTLQLKEQQFIEAARTSGTSNFRIITRHIIPNLFSIVVIASTLNIANTIISEAGISLLGLGVQSPGSSLGLMISDSTPFLSTYPYEALLPSAVLIIIVLAFSYLGDGLRDAFDPRSKD